MGNRLSTSYLRDWVTFTKLRLFHPEDLAKYSVIREKIDRQKDMRANLERFRFAGDVGARAARRPRPSPAPYRRGRSFVSPPPICLAMQNDNAYPFAYFPPLSRFIVAFVVKYPALFSPVRVHRQRSRARKRYEPICRISESPGLASRIKSELTILCLFIPGTGAPLSARAISNRNHN